MPKRSSEKNIFPKAACILAAVLLCLGGFFVFSGCEAQDNGTNVGNITANAEKTYYIKEEKFCRQSAQKPIFYLISQRDS